MALGETSLKKTDNIDALLGKSTTVPGPQQPQKGVPTIAAKLTEDEVEKIILVKKMLGTDNTSEALRWCIKAAWTTYGEKIKEIVDKKEAIAPIHL
jgi:rubrerythrin